MTTPAAEETDDKLGIRSFQWIHCKLYSVLLFMTHSSLVVVIRNFLFVTVLTCFSCRITNSDNSDAARSHTNSWPCACQGSAAGKNYEALIRHLRNFTRLASPAFNQCLSSQCFVCVSHLLQCILDDDMYGPLTDTIKQSVTVSCLSNVVMDLSCTIAQLQLVFGKNACTYMYTVCSVTWFLDALDLSATSTKLFSSTDWRNIIWRI